jgi:hypothetical protein
VAWRRGDKSVSEDTDSDRGGIVVRCALQRGVTMTVHGTGRNRREPLLLPRYVSCVTLQWGLGSVTLADFSCEAVIRFLVKSDGA